MTENQKFTILYILLQKVQNCRGNEPSVMKMMSGTSTLNDDHEYQVSLQSYKNCRNSFKISTKLAHQTYFIALKQNETCRQKSLATSSPNLTSAIPQQNFYTGQPTLRSHLHPLQTSFVRVKIQNNDSYKYSLR